VSTQLPEDLQLVEDIVYVGVFHRDQVMIRCSACGATGDKADEFSVAEIIEWARNHHEVTA
jgi:hypothetical protein